MTPKEEVLARYRQVEHATDATGRLIGVRRLKVSQQIKVQELTPFLEGMSDITDAEGKVLSIARRSIPLIAASVCEIDGNHYPFPRTRAELDFIMDVLDEEGISAAVRAFGTLVTPKTEDVVEAADSEADDVVAAAKK